MLMDAIRDNYQLLSTFSRLREYNKIQIEKGQTLHSEGIAPPHRRSNQQREEDTPEASLSRY